MSNYQINHVLMTADAVGSVWNYCMELASGLAKHGVRTMLATMGPPPSASQREMASSIPGLSLVVGDYKLEWMEDPWEDVDRASGWLLQLAERIRPDVVHLNGFCHAALPWRQPRVVAIHGDSLTWWQAVEGRPAPMPRWLEYSNRVREGLQAADLVIAPTAAMLREVQRTYGALDNTAVIHHGRDSEEWFVAAKKNLILSAGRLSDEAKNLGLLQSVAPLTQWPIYLAGESCVDSPKTHNLIPLGTLCPNAMMAWYSRAAIYAMARLRRHRRRRMAWYSRAAIYAMPAKYEPFGLSILEAALSGCALVLGDIPTLRELWEDVAVFVPPTDAHAWADVLNAIAEDDSLRETLGALARKRAKSYSAKTMACSTFFTYQDLVQASALDVGYHPGVSML